MRKKNQEITDPEVIEQILQGSVVCRIAMMDGDRPYILPFNYGYEEGYIYIHCAKAGRKLDLLRRNNSVCFEMEHTAKVVEAGTACNWATVYRSVVGYGEVEIISDDNEKEKGLEIIMRTNGAAGDLVFEQKNKDAMFILKLRITELTAKQSKNWDAAGMDQHHR